QHSRPLEGGAGEPGIGSVEAVRPGDSNPPSPGPHPCGGVGAYHPLNQPRGRATRGPPANRTTAATGANLPGGPATGDTNRGATKISRRALLKAGGALALAAPASGPWVSRAAAQTSPLRLGFQVHRTGIGAAYGRWYDRTTAAAVKLINERGGIGGRARRAHTPGPPGGPAPGPARGQESSAPPPPG